MCQTFPWCLLGPSPRCLEAGAFHSTGEGMEPCTGHPLMVTCREQHISTPPCLWVKDVGWDCANNTSVAKEGFSMRPHWLINLSCSQSHFGWRTRFSSCRPPAPLPAQESLSVPFLKKGYSLGPETPYLRRHWGHSHSNAGEGF